MKLKLSVLILLIFSSLVENNVVSRQEFGTYRLEKNILYNTLRTG